MMHACSIITCMLIIFVLFRLRNKSFIMLIRKRSMNKWGNIRVLNSVINDIKTTIQHNDRFSNVSDFAAYAIRKEIDRLEAKDAP